MEQQGILHSVRIHRFARIEVVVLEIRGNHFRVVALYFGLEFFNIILTLASFLELLDNFFEIACTNFQLERPSLNLFISCCDLIGDQHTFELALEVLLGLERPLARFLVTEEVITEGVHNVNDLLRAFIQIFVCFLCRGVGANIKIFPAFGHFSAIDFVYNIILLDQLVGI